MRYFTYILLLLALSFVPTDSSAQNQELELARKNKWELRGWPQESFSRKYIAQSGVKAYLLYPDSTVADSTTCYVFNKYRNSNVQFDFYVSDSCKDYIIKLVHPDYATAYHPVHLKFYKRLRVVDLGPMLMRKLGMSEKQQMLGEVVVKATKVKFTYRGDTIEYNADAFQLADGSMLDGLIRELPGAEIRKGGQIYVNGRFVDALLLNGKDFFKGHNDVMLENLPAYIVSKLSVYEEESDRSKLVGKKVDEGRYVMDVKLKKQYEIGWLGNVEGGYGTHDRYLGRAFALRFTPHSQLSFYANTNNLSNTRKPGQNGEWQPSDLNTGLTSFKTGGLSYNVDDKYEKFSVNGNAQASYSDNDKNTHGGYQYFLPSGDTYNRYWTNSRNKSFQLSTTNKFQYQRGNSLGNGGLQIQNTTEYEHDNSNSFNLNGTFNRDPEDFDAMYDSLLAGRTSLKSLINSTRKAVKDKTNQFSTSTYLYFYLPLRNSQDGVELQYSINYNNTTYKSNDWYHLNLVQEASDDVRRRYYNQPSRSLDSYIQTRYYYRRGNLLLMPIYEWTHSYKRKENSLYRLDQLEGWEDASLDALPSVRELQSVFDVTNSYLTGEYKDTHDMTFRVYYATTNSEKAEKQKGQFEIYFDIAARYQNAHMNFSGKTPERISAHAWFAHPYLSMFYYTPGRKHYFKLEYTFTPSLPSLFYMRSAVFDSDPLNIYQGNKNLKNSFKNEVTINYRAEKWLAGTGKMLSAYLDFTTTQRAVAMGYVYDRNTGIRTYMPENVNGNWLISFGSTFSTPVDKARKFQITSYTNLDYSDNVDLIGTEETVTAQRSVVHNLWAREDVRGNLKLGIFSLGMRARVGITHATSSREGFNTVNALHYTFGLSGTVNLPWKMQLATDFTDYMRRGYDDDALNTSDFVWNAKLSRNFMKNKLLVSLEGFDLLHQLTSVTYSLNGQGRREAWVNCIPRYVMLRAQYKFNIAPKKKK